MYNHMKSAFIYIIEYMEYLSIYHKSMWKVIQYTNEYVEEPHSPQAAVQELNDKSYAYRHWNTSLTCHTLLTNNFHLTVQHKIKGSYRLKFSSNLSDRVETCSDVVKRRSCHLFPVLHIGDRVVLPCTTGILNDLSCTLEVYQKVLHILSCISKGPFWIVVH